MYRRYSGMCACARNGVTCSREGETIQAVDLTMSETEVGRAFVELFPSDLEDVSGRAQDKIRNIGRQLKAQAAKMLELVQADATLPERLSWKAWNGLLPRAQQKHTSTGECFECATQFPEAMKAIALRDARDRLPKKRKRRGTGDTKPLATLYCVRALVNTAVCGPVYLGTQLVQALHYNCFCKPLFSSTPCDTWPA